MTDTPGRFLAALVQMRSAPTPAASLDGFVEGLREALELGADYIQTPEMTNMIAPDREAALSSVLPEEADPIVAAAREIARGKGVTVHLGSVAVASESTERAFNRALVIDPQGEIVARYDKIHMFDVDLPNGERYRESATYRPGDRAVACDLPFGRLGVTICYDMRFPSLYRALAEAGATLLAAPSAFTRVTGEAHWHVLLRSRAIENGAFVFAAAQGGRHPTGRETYGHSLIIDPWGRVLAEGGTEPGVIAAEIDLAEVAVARGRVPSLRHGRRFEVAAPAAEPVTLHAVAGGEAA